jgi:hypothetical protein
MDINAIRSHAEAIMGSTSPWKVDKARHIADVWRKMLEDMCQYCAEEKFDECQ